MGYVKVFAPASIGNVGPGFDVLGMAIAGSGDIVEAERTDTAGVRISRISGNNSLPKRASENTAGIAARTVLTKLGVRGGVKLKIDKRLPCGSGLGSSAASAVAAGYAVNLLFGRKLSKQQLIEPITRAEEYVSGSFFCDNTASSLLGGVILTKSLDPLEVIKLGHIPDVYISLVKPHIQILTEHARSILPAKIPLSAMKSNSALSCSVVASILKREKQLFCESINDDTVEPYRKRLIPGFDEVRDAALDAGAKGFAISGAGPAVFAVCENKALADKTADRMTEAFAKRNIRADKMVTRMHASGATRIY